MLVTYNKRKSQSKVVNALAETWGPLVAAANLPSLGSALMSAPIATIASIAGGAVGGSAVNKASEALTGRDFGTNVAMHTPLTPLLGEALNPGYTVGGTYGNFVGNNLANRGRYFLDNFTPAGYFLDANHKAQIKRMLLKPFYQAPPSFYGGRKPLWYDKYVKENNLEAAENRFQNGAIWAGISEDEVPITMYAKNADGSYRMTPEGIDYKNAALVPNQSARDPDFFTVGRVGGEHSDFSKLGERDGVAFMQFDDEQKINPQWMIASKIKDKFHIKDNSKIGKAIDFFGGKPLDWLVGYKPFTIKQNYLHNGNAILPDFNDPNNIYTPNFIIGNINHSLLEE